MTLLRAGDEFAGRSVLAYLGAGGPAEVYRVHDGTSGRVEALKIVLPDVGANRAKRACFRRECELAESLDHPNIATAYTHGEDPVGWPVGRLPWSTREYFPGGTAAELVPEPGASPDVALVVDVLGQVAAGLDHLHARDLVHRDVKPRNILLDHSDPPRAAITDFGLARYVDDASPLASHGRTEGSVDYAPPELLTAARLAPATDVYQLACVATELLTGRPPYPQASVFATACAHLSAPPPSLSARTPSLPPSVDPVVASALAKDPADRPDSCTAFVADLAISLA